MSNVIDKIRLSGITYTLSGQSSGSPTVELTQAQYDALVSAGTVLADTYYIITDAQAGDLSNYWTSAETQSAITEATSGKADTSAVTVAIDAAVSAKTDTSAFTAHTADTTVHTTSAEKTSWNGASTNASNAITALGGLSLVKLSQNEYDSLITKDSMTIYFIVN